MATNGIYVRIDATTAGFDKQMSLAQKTMQRYDAQLRLAQKAQAEFDAAVAKFGATSAEAVAAQQRLGAALARTTVAEQRAAIEAKKASEIQEAASAKQAAAADRAALTSTRAAEAQARAALSASHAIQRELAAQEAAEAKAAAAMEAAAAKQAAALKKVGTVAGGIGAAAAVGFGVAAHAAADFDAKLAKIQTLSRASASDMQRLSDSAHGFTDIGISASEAADAEIELVKAGVSVKDILGGGLRGALNLAAAGQLDVADATSIAAQAMTQFGLSGKDIPHIADLLSAGANKALGSVQDLGDGLSYAGGPAHTLGVSLEDTVATLAEFAQAGLIGQKGGAALQTMFARLVKPTAAAQAELDKYNISLYDSKGQFVGMSALAGEFQDNMSGLSTQTRNAALQTIFGNRAFRAAAVLYQDGAAGAKKWRDKVVDAGNAARTTAGQMDSLSGDIQKLGAILQNDLIDVGQQLQPILRTVTQDLEAIGNVIGGLPDPAKAAAVEFAAITGALGLGFWAFTRIKGAAVNLAETLGILAKAQTDVAVTAGAMAGAEDVAAAAMARESAVAKTGFLGGLNKGALGRTGLGIGALLGGSVLSQYSHGQSNGNVAAGIGSNALYGAGIGSFLPGPGTLIGGILGALYGAIKNERDHAGPGYSQNTAGNFSGGRTTTGTTWNGQTGSAMLAMDQHPFQVSTAQSTKVLDELGIAGEQTSRQLDGLGKSAKDAGGAFFGMSDAALSGFKGVKAFGSALDTLLSSKMDLSSATDQWVSGLQQLASGLSKSTKSLDGFSAGAEQNRNVIRTQVSNMEGLLNAQGKAGVGAHALSNHLVEMRQKLIDAGTAAGISKDDMTKYLGVLGLTPKLVGTIVKNNAPQAEQDIWNYRHAIDGVQGFKETVITAKTQEAENALLRVIGDLGAVHSKDVWINVNTNYTHSGVQAGGAKTGGLAHRGQIQRFSGGGSARLVRGPGGERGDKIPAMLSDYEFVNDAATVHRVGAANLFALNQNRATIVPKATQYLANGGMVGQSQQWRSGSQQVSVTISPDALRSALQGTTLMLATDVGTFKATIDSRVRAGVDGAAQQAKRFERAT